VFDASGPGGGSATTAGTDGSSGDGGSATGASSGGGTTGSGGGTDSSAGTTAGGPKFDVDPGASGGAGTDTAGGGPCDPDVDPSCMCTIPPHAACDGASDDPFTALGLNCPGELQVTTSTSGSAAAIGVRTSFGTNATFDPREGAKYAVIGSGIVAELGSKTPDGDYNDDPTYCNDDLGAFDPGDLPPPLDPTKVGTQDCAQDPSLVGTGDCSNTLEDQWNQAMAGGGCVINGMPCGGGTGGAANDYTELRFSVTVPPDVVSFTYDLAYFTTEWPAYAGSQYNDMYVGWLESEKWTGNISFDANGNPISLNAAFLELTDKKNDGVEVPELENTCMRFHGGTRWLTTQAGVTPGETITVVFAIFDLSDSILDSYVFLDNFQWGCDPSMPPSTKPEG
jgi:hypothetical protein